MYDELWLDYSFSAPKIEQTQKKMRTNEYLLLLLLMVFHMTYRIDEWRIFDTRVLWIFFFLSLFRTGMCELVAANENGSDDVMWIMRAKKIRTN